MLAAVVIGSGAFALEIRTAMQESKPKFFLKNGRPAGLVIDVLNAVSARNKDMRFTLRSDFESIPRIEYGLEKGLLDCFFSMAKNPERASRFTFLEPPFLNLRVVVAVRKNDHPKGKRLEELAGGHAKSGFLAVFGTAQAVRLRKMGLSVDDGGKNTESNLEKLAAKRGRFFVQTDLALHQAIRDGGFQEKVKVLPFVFEELPQYAVCSKKVSPLTIDALSQTLLELEHDGTLERIRSRYPH